MRAGRTLGIVALGAAALAATVAPVPSPAPQGDAGAAVESGTPSEPPDVALASALRGGPSPRPVRSAAPTLRAAEAGGHLGQVSEVRGRVVDESGGGVPGVHVAIRRDDHDLRFTGSAYATALPAQAPAFTDLDGLFRLVTARRDPSYVVVRVPEGFLPVDEVETCAGDPEILVTLRRGVRPRMRVVDPDGDAVAGASWHVLPASVTASSSWANRHLLERLGELRRLLQECRTDASGRALVEILAEVPQDIRFWPPSSRRDLAPLTLRAWMPRDGEVRLPKAHRVEGTVRDPSGRPVSDAEVRLQASDGSVRGASTTPDGRFAITTLPPGEVRITAAPQGGFFQADMGEEDPLFRPDALVEAGAPEVVLTVDPGRSLHVVVEGTHAGLDDRAAFLLREPDLARGLLGKATPIDGASAFRFSDVEAGARYVLWIPSRDESSPCLWATGIEADASPRKVRLRPGFETSAGVRLPPGCHRAWLSATRGSAQVFREVLRGRRATLPLLPGRWTIRASASVRGTTVESAIEIDAGDSVDIDLTGVPDGAR